MSDEKSDLATREGVEAFMQSALDATARSYAEVGEMPPHAIVFGTIDPRDGQAIPVRGMSIFVSSIPHVKSKADFVAAIRAFAVSVRAVGVAMFFEAWVKTIPTAEFDWFMAGYRDGLLAKLPERREAILVSLDHLAFPAHCSWMALIERDASGAPTLQPFKPVPGARLSGRFSDVFPRELYS